METFDNPFASNNLLIPEKCQECPIAARLETEIAAHYGEVEHVAKAALFANVKTARAVTLHRNTQRESALRDIDTAEQLHEQVIQQAQQHMSERMGDCEGPVDLEGRSPLGVVTARVCGSFAIRASEIESGNINSTEPATIYRSGHPSTGV